MEQGKPVPSHAEELVDPLGRPLGRVVDPRPGPVIGRASGTVYLVRPPGTRVRPPAAPGERRYAGGR